MTASPYSDPTLKTARRRLEILFAAFGEATGLPETFIGRVARNDPKFPAAARVRDFRHGSYDEAVARLSALWPDGTPWPEEVPRLAPAEVEEATRQELARRLSGERPAGRHAQIEALPNGADWPLDIPRPGAAANPEVDNG